MHPFKAYVLSLPERVVRTTLGVGAGLVRELGEVAVPKAIRRSQLYQSLVDTTLRFLIEQVGDVRDVYPDDEALAEDFLARRTAGNALEALGIVAFRASPVWVLAALADLSGMGRHLIPEIAEALKAQGLLESRTQFTSVEQMLDGLERTSARLADTINTPPLDVATLRDDWQAIRSDARSIAPANLPSVETLRGLWAQLTEEAARQDRSVFEASSVLAITAAQRLPGGLRWLSASTKVGVGRTSQVFAATLLDHYRETLGEIHRTGFVTYAGRQLRPYARAAIAQFAPTRRTLTHRVIERFHR